MTMRGSNLVHLVQTSSGRAGPPVLANLVHLVPPPVGGRGGFADEVWAGQRHPASSNLVHPDETGRAIHPTCDPEALT